MERMDQAAIGIPGPALPDDFRCPISLEIMSEPVILWTGQTYDRVSIQRWLDSGHTTCPKTKQELHYDTRLIPNYALRSVIHNWAQAHGIELRKPSCSSCLQQGNSFSSCDAHNARRRQQKEAVETLVKKISTSSKPAHVRDAVRDLRILAKESKQSRGLISEAGGVAKLLALLTSSSTVNSSSSSSDDLQAEIEENAVVAILNLTSDDENKVGMVAEGAVDTIVHILSRDSSSMDTKASAALAVTSLAMVDVNKAIIGRHPLAVPALTRLLRAGSPRGKKDAAIALYSLCMLPENRYRAISAGVISVILSTPPDGEASLALLDILSTCAEARAEMKRKDCLVHVLVRHLGRENTVRSRESCAAVLCSVCCEDQKASALACQAGAVERAVEMARTLPADSRAVRKASKLIQLLQPSSSGLFI